MPRREEGKILPRTAQTISCVHRLREERNLERIDLAYKLGCSYDHLRSIELLRRRPSLELLKRMSEVLEMDLGDLVKQVMAEDLVSTPRRHAL